MADPKDDYSLIRLIRAFSTEEASIKHFEDMRWNGTPTCPDCKSTDVYRVATERRLPLYQCRACRYQFTVTSGTVMQNTMLPLQKWLFAFHLMRASKKGISSRQLARALDVTDQSAWHMSHRIRAAMADNSQRLGGVVETDETYIGGRRKHVGHGYRKNKIPVQTIVEREHPDGTPGRAQTIALQPPAEAVDGRTVGAKLRTHVPEPDKTVLMTDESPIYNRVGESFKEHHAVNHKKEEYVREEADGRLAHTNTAEGLFGNLKRQITGTHHHTSKKHLPRYLEEFDHKYNSRDKTDGEITAAAIRRIEGRRVTLYRTASGGDSLFSRQKPVPKVPAGVQHSCESAAHGLRGHARQGAIQACMAKGGPARAAPAAVARPAAPVASARPATPAKCSVRDAHGKCPRTPRGRGRR